jgi:hypothetical protein
MAGRRFESERKGAAEKPLPALVRDALMSQSLLETIQEVKKLVEIMIDQSKLIQRLYDRVDELEHEISLIKAREK